MDMQRLRDLSVPFYTEYHYLNNCLWANKWVIVKNNKQNEIFVRRINLYFCMYIQPIASATITTLLKSVIEIYKYTYERRYLKSLFY